MKKYRLSTRSGSVLSKRPFCPNCHNYMEVVFFGGYYDEFNFWGCDCNVKIQDQKPDREVSGIWEGNSWVTELSHNE